MKLGTGKCLGLAAMALALGAIAVPANAQGVRQSDSDENSSKAKHETRFIAQFRQGDKKELIAAVEGVGGEVLMSYTPVIRALVIDVDKNQKRQLNKMGLVKRFTADRMLEQHALPAGYPTGAFPEFVPWGRDRVEADIVWSETPHIGPQADSGLASPTLATGAITGAGVRVGVLDSGIDHDHEDLVDNIENNCGSGVIRDFLPNIGMDDCPEDDTFNGHGTSVASVIASASNNVGLVGVAPEATIVPYRVCDGGCPLSSIIGGLVQAYLG